MTYIKYLVPLWIGVCIYVICSIFTGPTGLSAYEQLLVEQEELNANMESLRRLNADLENMGKSLAHDPDVIAIYARELGYADSGERFIHIAGMEKPLKKPIDAGQIFHASKPRHTSNAFIFTIAFTIAFAAFLCVLLPDLLHPNRALGRNTRGGGRRKATEQWHSIFN
jgi:cell division protein FtsB